MTRIIAGTAGGRRLRTPSGSSTRPTAGRVREALFSALESGIGLRDADVLDLYAGSGAIGLEALSRGARRALLVEHDRRTSRLIAKNAADLGFATASVVATKVETFVQTRPEDAFDIAFLDPPYDVDAAAVSDVVDTLVTGGWLRPDAWIVVERSSRDTFGWPESVQPIRAKKYDETVLWYGQPHA